MSENSVAKGIFLECLEPYILSDKLMGITAQVMKDLLLHFQDKNRLENMEACIVHMDITSLDIQQVCLPDKHCTEFLWINDSIPSLLIQTSFQYSIACGRQGVTFQQTNHIVQICGAFWPLICKRTALCPCRWSFCAGKTISTMPWSTSTTAEWMTSSVPWR